MICVVKVRDLTRADRYTKGFLTYVHICSSFHSSLGNDSVAALSDVTVLFRKVIKMASPMLLYVL